MDLNDDNDNDGAFVDMVTNAFGVILLITLFIFVASGAVLVQHVDKTNPEDETKTIDFLPSKRFLFPPYSRYYLFYADKVLDFDLNSVSRQLVNDPQKIEVSLPYAVFELFDGSLRDASPPPQYLFSDIDYYRLTFELVPSGIETVGQNLPVGDEAHFLDQVKAEIEMGTMMPTFMVHKTGMDLFARVFPYLMKSQIRFRWMVIKDKESFRRTPADFNRR
jgi:hypothetical protein